MRQILLPLGHVHLVLPLYLVTSKHNSSDTMGTLKSFISLKNILLIMSSIYPTSYENIDLFLNKQMFSNRQSEAWHVQ